MWKPQTETSKCVCLSWGVQCLRQHRGMEMKEGRRSVVSGLPADWQLQHTVFTAARARTDLWGPEQDWGDCVFSGRWLSSLRSSVAVKTSQTETKTSWRLESIEIQTRPRHLHVETEIKPRLYQRKTTTKQNQWASFLIQGSFSINGRAIFLFSKVSSSMLNHLKKKTNLLHKIKKQKSMRNNLAKKYHIPSPRWDWDP